MFRLQKSKFTYSCARNCALQKSYITDLFPNKNNTLSNNTETLAIQTFQNTDSQPSTKTTRFRRIY